MTFGQRLAQGDEELLASFCRTYDGLCGAWWQRCWFVIRRFFARPYWNLRAYKYTTSIDSYRPIRHYELELAVFLAKRTR